MHDGGVSACNCVDGDGELMDDDHIMIGHGQMESEACEVPAAAMLLNVRVLAGWYCRFSTITTINTGIYHRTLVISRRAQRELGGTVDTC